MDPQYGHQLSEDEQVDSDMSLELTIKVFERVGGAAGGKNYVLRDVKVGTISSILALKEFVVNEFGVWRG